MSIVSPQDVFDFDGYEKRIAGLDQAGEKWANSLIGYINRVKGSLDEVKGELQGVANALKSGTSNKSLEENARQIDTLAQCASNYRQQLDSVSQAEKANQALIQELTAKLEQLHARYKALDPSAKDYAKQQRAILQETKVLTKAIDTQNGVFKEGKRAADAAEGSYQKLSKQTNELRAKLKSMSDAFDHNTGKINQNNLAAVEMLQQIQKNDRALKAMDGQMGNYQRNVGNYGSALKNLGSSALTSAGSLIGITSVLEAVTSSLAVINQLDRIDASLKAVSKSSDDFSNSQAFLINLADRLGQKYEALAETYKGLKAATQNTALEGMAADRIFSAIATTGAKLQLSNEAVSGSLWAVTQMISKGKVQAEELRQQLGERLPMAIRLMAEAMGVSEGKLNKMMEQGELLASQVLPKLAAQLDKTYGLKEQEKIETMEAGWNRLTNQVHLFLMALNDDGKITGFFGKLSSGLADVFADLTHIVKSGEWLTFFGYMSGNIGIRGAVQGDRAIQQAEANAKESFRQSDPAGRQKELNRIGTAIKQRQAELNKVLDEPITDASTEREKKLTKQLDGLNARLKEYLKINKQLNTQEYANGERAKKQTQEIKAEEDKKKAEKAKTEQNKRQSELDKKTSEAMSKAKAGNDKELSVLTNSRQDGLISEQKFIEERLRITLSGIEQRQQILENAGKKETDDYKKLISDKIDADSEYKREQLKLDLSASKSQTDKELSKLDDKRSQGLIDERAYVEERHRITTDGINRRMTILEEAGQKESELYTDTDAMLLEEQAKYHDARIKAEADSWKKQLQEVKEGLSTIDRETAESLNKQLNDIASAYDERQQALALRVAKRQISPEDGNQMAHSLKLDQLKEEVKAIEDAYNRSKILGDMEVAGKIAGLERYKAEATRTPKEIAEADIAISKLRKEREDADAKGRMDKDKEVADKRKQLNAETTQSEIDKLKEVQAAREAIMNQAFELAGTIGSAIFDISASRSQRELDLLQKQKDHELSLVGDNADARANIEKEFAKKQDEIRIKQAKAERMRALFQIGISTAQAVMSVLSTGGGAHYLDFGTSAGILSALVTATGAAQIAAVLAQPLPTPAYKTGKRASDPYTGPALAGEAGAELWVQDGKARLLDRPTMISTKRGDTIYTASETDAILAGMRQQAVTAPVLDMIAGRSRFSENMRQSKLMEQALIQQLASTAGITEKGLERAFGRALDGRPVHETSLGDDGRFHNAVRSGNSRHEYLNKRNSFR